METMNNAIEMGDMMDVFSTSYAYMECYMRVCKLFTQYDEIFSAKEKDARKYKKLALDILLEIQKANTIMQMNSGIAIEYWGWLENKAYEKCKELNDYRGIHNVEYRDWFKESRYHSDKYWERYDGVTIVYAVRDEMTSVLGV